MRGSYDRSETPGFIKFIVTIASLACVSFAVALVWQNAQDSMVVYGASGDKEKEKSSVSSQVSEIAEKPLDSAVPLLAEPVSVSMREPPDEDEIDSEPEKSESSPESSDDSDGSDDEDSSSSILANVHTDSVSYARAAVEGAVPPSAVVEYSYFDDAIFFGDSISTGIPLYMKTMVPNAAVIAMQGVSPDGANTSQCIDVGGKKVTMLEAAKTKGERKKVYIMLGANGLDMDEKSFMDGYKTFVVSVKALYPDAIIYIQSMLPVTTHVNQYYPSKNINNQRISSYNDSIRAMAKEQGVYYLDVAQCMVDSNGVLPMEASKFDGMHLSAEYYIKWFDYLRSHTVKDKK